LDKTKKCFGAHHFLLEELRREDPNSYKNWTQLQLGKEGTSFPIVDTIWREKTRGF
jgi:hypothetical protein